MKPIFMVRGDTITILGELEAMNGYGGYGRVSYFCTKERSAPTFEGKDVLLIDFHPA